MTLEPWAFQLVYSTSTTTVKPPIMQSLYSDCVTLPSHACMEISSWQLWDYVASNMLVVTTSSAADVTNGDEIYQLCARTRARPVYCDVFDRMPSLLCNTLFVTR
jgi:hypothetical protein